MNILVTGGAGFIGSALIRYIIRERDESVVNIDKLTYAGNLDSLEPIEKSDRYTFRQIDICDSEELEAIFWEVRPDAVIHLAAESHVDRSIDGPAAFIETNIIGTYTLLQVGYRYWQEISSCERSDFRFLHVSTDEVYGDLGNSGAFFTEQTAYAPNSPYSASKASSDHLVRAWLKTYEFPAIITHCSNNYGPYHFPEKLIPLIILNAIEGKPLPVYGRGDQIRDWLFVEDHARALCCVLSNGKVGEIYNIGGHNEYRNIEVVSMICELLEDLMPEKPAGVHAYKDLIRFVEDRPGHDLRYAIDSNKIRKELGWFPLETFETGLRTTVQWYLDNLDWCHRAQEKNYQRQRLGMIKSSKGDSV